MRVFLISLVLIGCHRDLDDGVVADSAPVAETSTAETALDDTGVADSGVVDSISDSCECAPGEVAPVSGTCPGALEKKTKTCETTCKWGAETCALPKGWTVIATPTSFEGRLFAASAWTGGELIVHGGQKQVEGGDVFGDGAIYSAFKNTWTALPTTGAPSARGSHAAVWTGLELIVWGGAKTTTYLADGAIYDAFTKMWRALPAAPIAGRAVHCAAWVAATNEMIVWGGRNESGYLGDGASFATSGATWTKLPTAPISARSLALCAWTGSELLIWGGQDASGRLVDGALYDPLKKSWRKVPAAPVGGRIFSSSALAVDRFAFFGGIGATTSENDGASLLLADLTWTKITAPASSVFELRSVPAAWQHGDSLYMWSGARDSMTAPALLATGAAYDLKSGAWSVLPTSGAPSPRIYATAASTKFGGIVWSGVGMPGGGAFEVLTDGAIYVP